MNNLFLSIDLFSIKDCNFKGIIFLEYNEIRNLNI